MNKFSNLGMILALLGLSACGQTEKKETPSETVAQSEPHIEMTQQNQVVETIMARRSIRKYKEQAVETEKLQEILKCGINAPNGMYKESWEIRVVQDPKLLDEIDKGFAAFRAQKGNTRKMHASYGAPCLIFIAHDTNYELSQVDCGLLGGNIILAAQSMGLGTCCLGGLVRYVNAPEGAEFLKRLELSDSSKLLYAISLGYPDETPAAKPRNIEKIKYIN